MVERSFKWCRGCNRILDQNVCGFNDLPVKAVHVACIKRREDDMTCLDDFVEYLKKDLDDTRQSYIDMMKDQHAEQTN